MRYRRANIGGASYFFTVNLNDRRSTLLVDNIELLRSNIKIVKSRHPFEIDAMVVMPEHLHCIWALPEGDADFAKRWSLIKSGFSRKIPQQENITISRESKRERGIWQRRYWEHLIRDELDFERHVNYILMNPVKHGYVKHAVDWPYSSIHRMIRDGIIAADWGTDIDDKNRFGE